MLAVAVVLVLAPLAWLLRERLRHAGPAARAVALRRLTASIAAVLVLRVVLVAPLPLKAAICLLSIGALVVWLRRRGGQGGDGPGDDGRDPPVDPGPDPRPEQLDPEGFDRARAEWEQALKK
jgi:hypothetical protein